MKNDGKAAERAFFEYWDGHGHIERLRDKKDLVGLNGGDFRIADFKKPSDFLVSDKATGLHYAEVKSTQHATTFHFGLIQDGQSKAALMSHTRGDGRYLFYIYSYGQHKWYIMTAAKYAESLAAKRRSVKFEELVQWLR